MTPDRSFREPARGGGVATADGYLFELTGGALCLDFANTVDSRPSAQPHELLPDYEALLRWSVQAGALTPEVAKRLRRRATDRPRQGMSALYRARRLREALFETFSAAAGGRSPPARALEVLNASLPGALTHLRVGRASFGYEWVWEQDDALDRMLRPVVRSAADLLVSDQLDRVRRCASDTCDWLFLDQSKNRSRRWCDMTVCGNRSKVRRFRETRGGAS